MFLLIHIPKSPRHSGPGFHFCITSCRSLVGWHHSSHASSGGRGECLSLIEKLSKHREVKRIYIKLHAIWYFGISPIPVCFNHRCESTVHSIFMLWELKILIKIWQIFCALEVVVGKFKVWDWCAHIFCSGSNKMWYDAQKSLSHNNSGMLHIFWLFWLWFWKLLNVNLLFLTSKNVCII